MHHVALALAMSLGIASCSNAQDRNPSTHEELVSDFVAALAANDCERIERYTSSSLSVKQAGSASSLDDMLAEIERSDCSTTEGYEPQLTDSKVSSGSTVFRGHLTCEEGYARILGGINFEISIQDMLVSDVDWYFLTVGASR